jgi:hypothetical protein
MKLFTLLGLFFVCSIPARAVDLVQLEKDLNGAGVTGWIHGSVADRHLYVFTYRTPGNF